MHRGPTSLVLTVPLARQTFPPKLKQIFDANDRTTLQSTCPKAPQALFPHLLSQKATSVLRSWHVQLGPRDAGWRCVKEGALKSPGKGGGL